MRDEDTVELPELLGRYFWDYAPGRLTWPESRHTIVGRLLEAGGFDAVRWLRRHVGDQGIREFITQRRGRGIDPKRLRYWELILGMPKEEVDRWIEAALQNPWYRRTNA
jgi:hypothetical protein